MHLPKMMNGLHKTLNKQIVIMTVTKKYLSFKSSLSIQRDIEVISGHFVQYYLFPKLSVDEN